MISPTSPDSAQDLEVVNASPEGTDTETELAEAGSRSGDLKKLELWLSFAKFVLGSFTIGLITIYLNNQIQEREVLIKEKDQEQQYLKNFIGQAMEQDLTKRVSFAEYFSILLGGKWRIYYEKVNRDLEKHNSQIAEKNAQMEQASKITSPASSASQVRPPGTNSTTTNSNVKVETLKRELTVLQLETKRRSSWDYEQLFPSVRTDELKLSQVGEEAFTSGNYTWAARFLEQARLVESSGVWQSSYPFLIGSYLMLRQKIKADDATSQMFAAIDRQYGYLTSDTSLGFLVSNFGRVRNVVANEYLPVMDDVIDKVLDKKEHKRSRP